MTGNESLVLKNLLDCKVFSVNLSGGEPLLHPMLQEIISSLHRACIDVCVSTNGWEFPRLSSRLISAGLDMLQVSIDGPRDIHDSFRGRSGAFDRAVSALKMAVEAELRTQLNVTITSKNIDHLEYCINLACELGVDRVFFRRVVPFGRGLVNKYVLPLKTLYLKRIRELAEMNVAGLDISIDDPVLAVIKGGCFGSVGCSAGIKSVGISCAGEVYPCIFLREKIGVLTECSLKDIWQTSPVLSRLRHRDIDICGSCSYSDSCGGCRAFSGIFNQDAFCPIFAEERTCGILRED